MKRSHIGFVLVFICFVVWPQRTSATELQVDGRSALAVLDAISNPRLTEEEALSIARLPGNQGLIRKQASQGDTVSETDFAAALLAASRNREPQSEGAKAFGFTTLKARAARLRALLRRIETSRDDFEGWVVQRVSMFSPPLEEISLQGYLIVGGGSGGYAFGEKKFYLNLAYFDDYDVAKLVMAHELYHAVQAVTRASSERALDNLSTSATQTARETRECLHLCSLFASLYAEGSASLVGDPLQIATNGGPKALRYRADFESNLRRVDASATLLELSVIGLQADAPPPFDDVYALGFYVPETLYALGYAMAKAIQQSGGDAALAKLATEPGHQFARAYAASNAYGVSRNFPKLGPNTLAALDRIQRECAE
jgi:hypothetical protein